MNALFSHLRNPRRGRQCGNWTWDVEAGGVRKLTRFLCKTYGCCLCGPVLARQIGRNAEKQCEDWISRATIAGEKFCLPRLLTLTMPPEADDPATSRKVITKYWNAFLSEIKRKFGIRPEYMWFIEWQERGAAHLHVLINCFLPKRWVSMAWERIGGGEIVDIRAVRNGKDGTGARIGRKSVCSYVTKYLVKTAEMRFFVAKNGKAVAMHGLRRWGASRGIKLRGSGDPFSSDVTAVIIKDELKDVAWRMGRVCTTAIELSEAFDVPISEAVETIPRTVPYAKNIVVVIGSDIINGRKGVEPVVRIMLVILSDDPILEIPRNRHTKSVVRWAA